MNKLTKRQKEIILLLSKSDDPTSSEWIAKELGISDRTVRNEIKLLQRDIVSSFGLSIKAVRGKGYQLKILDSKKLNEHSLKGVERTNNFDNQNHRVTYILTRLLLAKDFVKLESFLDEMFVSMSTIKNDLKLVRKILKKYNLRLTNRPHYGSKVEGDEYMKRLCLSNSLPIGNQESIILDQTLNFVNETLFLKIKEILIKKVNQFKVEISDISLENLATHIAIACKRIKEGFLIEDFHVLMDEYPFEKVVAEEIVQEVEIYTGLTFPDSEIEYIIVHLVGTKLLHEQELIGYSELDEVGSIVSRILERLRAELNWDFRSDMEFIQALTLHIRPAMNRLRYKMNIRNPLVNEIKTKYPAAFEGAIIAGKCIEDYLNIEVVEDEIAYIALHISVALERMQMKKRKIKRVLVVCASGIGSARLLYYRLQNKFEHQIEVVDTISYYKLSSYDLSTIDLIISTVPIKEKLQMPVQVVNTFLEERDVHSIKNYISQHQNALEQYLHPSRIFIHQHFDNKEAVISFLCNQLYREQLVPDNFKDLVLEREAIAPTCYGNLVAVPHPIHSVTTETFWTVCTLDCPIPWSEQQMVQFICLLNVKQGSHGDLDRMFKKLISIIENKTIVQKLIESKTPNDIIELIK
ncbi:PRD domain-containing protein [Bacillus coagulans]|uniref:BglG family transcription antiterminator n=1 Tax=Heyndrickxia coagulans TaxID=1398 RepID=UPI000779E135|nr:BglG family transcription antiterminator [Heyndrickxia coagulans]NCG67466.1 PRD domain-containing protein [Heyndrickxia coagulans]